MCYELYYRDRTAAKETRKAEPKREEARTAPPTKVEVPAEPVKERVKELA